MTESIELAIIRREALLLALARFRGNFFDSAITVTSLAEELGIHRTILGFVARPLISEGLIILQGEQGSESAVITENGRSEADEIVKRRSSLRAGTKVLFIDTEPEVIERIKEAGYSVFKANMGYRTGERGFSFPPPNEVDLIVCDLRCPACFDSKYWGPGKNNNQSCTVIPYQSVNNKYYMKGDKRNAEHQVIQESQLGAQIPGTFGPKDVNNAIVKGGVPCIIFLNKEWLDRAVSFPNWLDARWAFDRTAATQVTVGEPLSSLIPEIGTEVRLKLAIQHMIRNGPHVGQINLPSKTSVTNIFTNNIGDVFGQFVKMGKGTVWLIPATHENASIIELFASRMESVRQLAHSPEELSSALWEDIRRAVGLESPKKSETAQELIMPSNKIKLFVSHSSADADIAQKLIDLLRSGIPELPPAAIRCTSVPGYGLEGGADTNQEIFEELLGAEVLVALLSEQSLKSTYVLFELGARWGAKKHFFPLVVAGMGKSELNAPLNGRNAHSAAIETDLHQLVDEVAIKLGFEHPKPQVYTPQLKALVAASVKEGEQRNHAM